MVVVVVKVKVKVKEVYLYNALSRETHVWGA